jgi:hypothetical protein
MGQGQWMINSKGFTFLERPFRIGGVWLFRESAGGGRMEKGDSQHSIQPTEGNCMTIWEGAASEAIA